MLKADYRDIIAAALGDAQKSTGGWYRTNCPVCVMRTGKDDKRWSMGFHPDTGRYKCFRCQTGGVLTDDFSDMADANPEDEEDEEIFTLPPPDGFMLLGEEPGTTADKTEEARWYLEDRNVPLATWRACGIGVTYTDKKFRNRIIVPIKDDDTWYGYIGRIWDEESNNPLRYRYPAGMKRGGLLWNHHALFADTDTPILICEGIFDALPHFPNAISCLGKPSYNQMPALNGTSRPLVFALDGDAWQEAEAFAMKARFDGKTAAHIRFPPKTDPGDLQPGELLDMGLKAISAQN